MTLRTVYDHVIPVDRIRNSQTENLQLMGRADLHSAFTKINLWKLTQFRKIVYIDADIVAYRAPDELFDLPHAFSAAPDIGWPDLFNTGVMALTPNMGDFDAMLSLAERGVSLDGADQGLINEHFKDNHNRISFTYNVTPSAHYQYLPAYRHFQNSINMVHFIGSDKPWFQGRDANSQDGSPYSNMVNKWWAVYDRHYGKNASDGSPSNSSLVQSLTKGEFNYQPTSSSWNAQKGPPPVNSRPEAANFPTTVYAMSTSHAPFVPPMYYEAQNRPTPKPIFPWEAHRPAPSRVFSDYTPQTQAPALRNLSVSTVETKAPSSSAAAPSEAALETPVTESASEQWSEPATPTSPGFQYTASDPWVAFTRTNAWDDIPEIEKYVGTMQQKHRRPRGLKSPGMIGLPNATDGAVEQNWGRRGSKVTDFPTQDERPSLPVTPAPIRRHTFWGGGSEAGTGYDGDDDSAPLPAAEGVPEQTQWVCSHGRRLRRTDCLCDLANILTPYYKDPVAQLEKLARQHAETLLQRLGGEEEERVDSNPNIVSPQPLKASIAPSGFSLGTAKPAFLMDSGNTTPLAAPRRPVRDETTTRTTPTGRKNASLTIHTGSGPAPEEAPSPTTSTTSTVIEEALSSSILPLHKGHEARVDQATNQV
ncbi:glycogenin glucosyltransferase [Diatrype stigma]|uniref:glycogenin glucosyltransferase n=1 Tax=Diatrype stigma TaxID=117547 RepID=A0AAN9YSX7_9PEZI